MATAPPTVSTGEEDSLLQRLVEDMNRRWRDGDRVRAEEYLARWPDVVGASGAALELIYEEICLRREHGEDVRPSEVYGRFPQWQAELSRLLACHRALGPQGTAPRFPAAGETLGDFRLIAELGRGSAGRVFLARQAALADRPVVLKLIPLAGREHLTLARLQHTNIVPLYTAQDDPDRDLRLLCMPYFGGMALGQLLSALRDRPPGRRTGAEVLAVLRQARTTAPVLLPDGGPAAEELAGPSYVRAVCWIGACLADALQYAHERGLLHLDVKPSNVLLAADGSPMLLDFHLARAAVRAGAPPPEWMGGTPAYMAPEQEAALAAVRAGRPLTADVDGRADVYALGLVLYEALGGEVPAPARAPGRALRRLNPRVTVGLGDILERCLARDPRRRYPRAADLAEDLRRHLADLPLRGVANRDPLERLAKWRRRWPSVRVVLSLVAVVLLLGGGVAWDTWQSNINARKALDEGRAYLVRHQYADARASLDRGLALADHFPFFPGGVAGELRQERQLAEWGEKAQSLHRFVEEVRPLYGVEEPGLPGQQIHDVLDQCNVLWVGRQQIVQRLAAQPPPDLGDQVRTDMLDLAIVWADLRVRFPQRGQDQAARAEALHVLDEAERLFGPSCVLTRERRDLEGKSPEVEPLPPRTAWEHYALGRALLRDAMKRHSDFTDAEYHLGLALNPEPPTPWPYFYHGRCAYEKKWYSLALADFSEAVARAPDSPWCFFDRAQVYGTLGKPEDLKRAENDYSRALQLDTSFAPAALQRGLIHYRMKKYAEALDDFLLAQKLRADPAGLAYGRALVYVAQGDRAAAVSQLREALRLKKQSYPEAQALLDTLEER
jgi:serine/threonine protein kinase